MNFDIRINTDYGFHWLKTPLGYVSATAFLGERYLDDAAWKEILSDLNTPEDAAELASRLNGSFAMALMFEDMLFLCADRQRTIPIFYELSENTVTVYNHISLEKIKENGADVSVVDYLEHCLFIPGEKTAAKGVCQVMAGKYVLIDGLGSVVRKDYVSQTPVKEYADEKELMTLIDQKFTETIKRLIAVLDGRRAIVPLSGGHDSRLIVYYLKRLGYDNILTYTYGPKGNFESETSQKVAEYLGLDWHFVAYKPRKLQKFFRQEFRKVADYYSNGVSSVCVQDWYAVHELKRQGILNPSDVFVPGHSFDCISGSFILPRYVENESVDKEALFADILWKHFGEGKRVLPAPARQKIRQLTDTDLLKDAPEIMDAQEAFSLYQRYNIAERQAKYICNQVRLYEYYGFSCPFGMWSWWIFGNPYP